MDWKEYEQEIEKQFRDNYPSAEITRNAKVPGKFSKVERQIDLMIEEQASDFSFRIIVDAKHRGRKIDVADVEQFLGMIRDVEAHTGVLVALEGYTPAAINRAHYDDLDVILDVLNLEELKRFQGFTAIPYAADCGAVIGAPFGWIIDGDRRPGMLASIYERGLSLEEARKRNEWMYINFWHKRDKPVNSLEALLKYQESYLRRNLSDAEIEILQGAQGQRTGARTLIRRMKTKNYPVPEYTGFVDFEKFVFMCVLFSPEQLERKNLRKLRFVLREVFPMNVSYNHTASIAKARAQLQTAVTKEQKSQVLSKMGFWFREMGELEEARKCLAESVALVPTSYNAVKQLIEVQLALEDKMGALTIMGGLLRLDPHNPTVFNDCFDFLSRGRILWSELLEIIEKLRAENDTDELTKANCDFYAGNLLVNIDPVSAGQRYTTARRSFERILPPDHYVFETLDSVLKQMPPAEKSAEN
jgi:tetratricopeptide (TPR) repeat protein